jgi:hypothetical protein
MGRCPESVVYILTRDREKVSKKKIRRAGTPQIAENTSGQDLNMACAIDEFDRGGLDQGNPAGCSRYLIPIQIVPECSQKL